MGLGVLQGVNEDTREGSAQGLAPVSATGSGGSTTIFLSPFLSLAVVPVGNSPVQFRALFPGSPGWWLPGPAGFKFICSFIRSFIC